VEIFRLASLQESEDVKVRSQDNVDMFLLGWKGAEQRELISPGQAVNQKICLQVSELLAQRVHHVRSELFP
jgi:hypothetical protein